MPKSSQSFCPTVRQVHPPRCRFRCHRNDAVGASRRRPHVVGIGRREQAFIARMQPTDYAYKSKPILDPFSREVLGYEMEMSPQTA